MTNRQVVVKTYAGKQHIATAAYRRDAVRMADKGYYPTSQSWAPGAYGCSAFLIALVLCFFLIGFLVFIYMLIVKPAGALSVTYEQRLDSYNNSNITSSPEKVCPKCAETVKAAALVCRYCGHEFSSESIPLPVNPPAGVPKDAFTYTSPLANSDPVRSVFLGFVVLIILFFVGRTIFDHSHSPAQDVVAQQPTEPVVQTPQPDPAPSQEINATSQTEPVSQAASVPSAFDQGHADRLKWENWVDALTGAEHDGAIYWSGQRSLETPGTCEAGAAAAYPNDISGHDKYSQGCYEAQDMLNPFDVKRKSDPVYRLGWNAPVQPPS